MRSAICLLILTACGCGPDITPAASAEPEPIAEGAAVVARMDDIAEYTCRDLAGLLIVQTMQSHNPDWAGDATVLPNVHQFVLHPEGNEFGATHLIVCRVKLEKADGREAIQIWSIHCRDGVPVAVKNLSLGLIQG